MKLKLERIPKISAEELKRRTTIALACAIQENKDEADDVVLIKKPNLKNAYLWDWKKDRVIGFLGSGEIMVKTKPVPGMPGASYCETVAEMVGEFITLHGCAYYGFYKPSIEEIMAQLPEEIFTYAEKKNKKLYYTNRIFAEGDVLHHMIQQEYHVAKTTVYIENE